MVRNTAANRAECRSDSQNCDRIEIGVQIVRALRSRHPRDMRTAMDDDDSDITVLLRAHSRWATGRQNLSSCPSYMNSSTDCRGVSSSSNGRDTRCSRPLSSASCTCGSSATPSIDWQSRAHFYAVAAENNSAHPRRSRPCGETPRKRPNPNERVPFDGVLVYSKGRADEVLIVDEALGRLTKWDPRQAKIVELRYFGGYSVEETAEVLGVSERTVKRDWIDGARLAVGGAQGGRTRRMNAMT